LYPNGEAAPLDLGDYKLGRDWLKKQALIVHRVVDGNFRRNYSYAMHSATSRKCLNVSRKKEVGHRRKIQQFWQKKKFARRFGTVLVTAFVRTALHTGQLRQIKDTFAKFV